MKMWSTLKTKLKFSIRRKLLQHFTQIWQKQRSIVRLWKVAVLNRNYQTKISSSEPIYSLGRLAIYSIPYRSVQVSERAIAYLTRFQKLNVANLFAFDGISTHYEIWEGQSCLGGFRLSPIGGGQSEVEE